MTVGFDSSWVLFKHGTVVVLNGAVGDLKQAAIEFLSENGPVVAGTPLGDFGVNTIKQCPGWLVTSHNPNLVVYVAPEEQPLVNASKALHNPTEHLQSTEAGDGGGLAVGLFGRAKREHDSSELCVIHVEDKRRTS